MSRPSDINTPLYYPEDYNYSIYYENELRKYQNLNNKLPTINYLNERKCPIYVHDIKKDSSVYNNYNEKMTRKTQNASKFVLDKLEETYWATWKPKKSSTIKENFKIFESKPAFQEYKGSKRLNRSHGDVSDDIIKFFKAKRFDSSSTTDSTIQHAKQKKSHPILSSRKSSEVTKTQNISNEQIKSDNKKLIRPSNSRQIKLLKKESQEIQTEVLCPIILEESQLVETQNNNLKPDEENDQQIKKEENIDQQTKKVKSKKKIKKHFRLVKNKAKETGNQGIINNEENQEDTILFVEHKDSIEITKKKQENEGPKEHFQQPNCIRLYRKSGATTGYIRGGTYPLKSCLKNNAASNGNFKLGAPGSPLFVTSSFSRKK